MGDDGTINTYLYVMFIRGTACSIPYDTNITPVVRLTQLFCAITLLKKGDVETEIFKGSFELVDFIFLH